tara:strand:+ start:2191 stop:4197 length:2007 start_codon:yes stop_codon:yes gene_type:complete
MIIVSAALNAQTDRKLIILDLSVRNGETNQSRMWSATRIAEVAGISYNTTSSLNTALNYPVILMATKVSSSTFTPAEFQQIKDYVFNGGTVIISALKATELFQMAGVSSQTSSNRNYRINWDIAAEPDVFYMINDSLETTISLGDLGGPATFISRHYQLDGGLALGRYESDSVAAVHNVYGSGNCYLIGTDFRDVIYRNMADMDINANRTYSNGFEPTSDVICFWVRNIVRKSIPNTIHKYTIPGKAKSIIMMTHDVDSNTALDTMLQFSSYQKNHGILVQYNITTRYFSDDWFSDIYVGTYDAVEQLKTDGHTLASHSVGHFPDFADFPYGISTVDSSTYKPGYFNGHTINGTVLGEVVVSKNLLETDHLVNIRSFRSGHLAYPDSLIMALEATGYAYNSSNAANNVLTGFPYYAPKVRSFNTTMSSVIELPLTISDVLDVAFFNENDYADDIANWIAVSEKYADNNSPVILLIHPNRRFKVTAMDDYYQGISSGIKPYLFQDYGDYWAKRNGLEFHSTLANDTLNVYFDTDSWVNEQSFVIDNKSLKAVHFYDFTNKEIVFKSVPWEFGQTLYYVFDRTVSTHEINANTLEQLTVYPNPFNQTFVVNVHAGQKDLKLIDLTGKIVWTGVGEGEITIDLSSTALKSGMYFIQASDDSGISVAKIIKK